MKHFNLSHTTCTTDTNFLLEPTGFLTESRQMAQTNKIGGFAISYITIGVIGIIGNLFSAFVLISSKKTRQSFFNILLINQCFIDCTTATILIGSSFNVYDSEGNYGLLGKIRCFIWNNKVLLWSLFLSSTFNLIALNFERYLGVVFPIFHKTKLTKLHVYITAIFVWLSGFIYNLPLKIATSYVENGKCVHMKKWPNHNVQQFGGVLNSLLYLFIPVICMVFVSVSIMRVLQQRSKVTQSEITGGQSDGKVRVTKMSRLNIQYNNKYNNFYCPQAITLHVHRIQ